MVFYGPTSRRTLREEEVRDARAAQDARIAELRLIAQQRFDTIGLPRR